MSELARFYTALEQHGCRITPQRQMILEHIAGTSAHISAEDIFETIHQKYPRIELSTVYRTMELLKKCNLVTETDLGDGKKRFHSIFKGHHHHLICQNCKKVIELDQKILDALKSEFKLKYGFEADLTHMAFSGHCRECQ
jgi:Fur family ferric uptake transcriptional regulator